MPWFTCSHAVASDQPFPTNIPNVDSCPVHSFTGVENALCVVVDVAACDIGEFTCIRDRSCTNIHNVCDGQVNCADGSDELDCGELRFIELLTPVTTPVLLQLTDSV